MNVERVGVPPPESGDTTAVPLPLAAGLVSAVLAVCGCQHGRMGQLTFGPGNDTEAVWSPDGGRMAFQTDRTGDLDIEVLNLADGKRASLVGGPGHACYPAWTPDGGVVYVFGNHAGTAAQAEQATADCGYGLRLWKDGSTQVLTRGYWRDFTPSVTADGRAVYYSSTQGAATSPEAGIWKEHVTIRRLPLTSGAVSECVLPMSGETQGAVQPSCSPDNRFLVWAYLDGAAGNWRICGARAETPSDFVFLTPGEMSAYAPRWSPDGRCLALTGFRKGDPGWGIFLLEPRSGAMVRLQTGEGHSRTPAWSPDGRELVFENNRTGCYKLYRMTVRCGDVPAVTVRMPAGPSVDRVEARLERRGAAPVLVGADGRFVKGVAAGKSALAFDRPGGLDFGAGAFFVRMTLAVDAVEKGIRIAAVGSYAEHELGWQVFIRENGRLFFSPRSASGGFREVGTLQPVATGKPLEVLCIRDADGGARLYLDGVFQGRCGEAGLKYGPALKVCLGKQWSGGMELNGRVLAFECGRGYPAGVPRMVTREAVFGGAAQ